MVDSIINTPIIMNYFVTKRCFMNKRCSGCAILIDESNCVRRDEKRIRSQCKSCMSNARKNYNLSSGLVKMYDCERCGTKCFRFQKRALCSLKCRLLGNIEKVKCENIPNEECWEWKGRTTDHGYGEIMISRTRFGVHRVSYEVFKGNLNPSKNMVVRHKCDNRACINPQHLEQGTLLDNINDMKVRGRSLKGKKTWRDDDVSEKRKSFSKIIKELS